MPETLVVAADDMTGFFAPNDVRPGDWPRLDPTLLSLLAAAPGLTPTASDVMHQLGGVALVVLPDDLVLTDANGVCFIPVELAEQAADGILEVATRELDPLHEVDMTGPEVPKGRVDKFVEKGRL